MVMRGLVALVLMATVASAQPAQQPGEQASANLRPVVRPQHPASDSATGLAGTVSEQQFAWSRLLSSMSIGKSLQRPAGASLQTRPNAPVREAVVPGHAVDSTGGGPLDDNPRHVLEAALPGVVSVDLPVARTGSPMVVARTPRRVLPPTRSGSLRISSAPLMQEPLAVGTLRQLRTASARTPLESILASSTRTASPNVRFEAPGPDRSPVDPAWETAREDGFAASQVDAAIPCQGTPVWVPIWAPTGSVAGRELTSDGLRDAQFRPENALRTRVSLEEIDLAATSIRDSESPRALNWAWDEETMLRFESVTDEENRFEGTGRTWLLTIFTGL